MRERNSLSLSARSGAADDSKSSEWGCFPSRPPDSISHSLIVLARLCVRPPCVAFFAHTCTEWVLESVCNLPGLLNTGESHVKCTQIASWSPCETAVQTEKRGGWRWRMEKLLTHTGIVCVRAGGAATYCLRSAPASCLSAHSQNTPVHMSDLCASEPVHVLKRGVNASVRLAGLLRRARTGLQAGILMSVFWLEKEECNLRRALTVKLPVPEMWGLIGKSVRLWFDHVTSYILVR